MGRVTDIGKRAVRHTELLSHCVSACANSMSNGATPLIFCACGLGLWINYQTKKVVQPKPDQPDRQRRPCMWLYTTKPTVLHQPSIGDTNKQGERSHFGMNRWIIPVHKNLLTRPEICTMTRSPIHFYYRLIRLAPISIYKQCISHLQALCSNRCHGYGRILNNAHQTWQRNGWKSRTWYLIWNAQTFFLRHFEISTLRLYK